LKAFFFRISAPHHIYIIGRLAKVFESNLLSLPAAFIYFELRVQVVYSLLQNSDHSSHQTDMLGCR